MDYAVSRYGNQVLTMRPAHQGFKDLGGGFRMPMTDPGVHVKFQELDAPFDDATLPAKFGRSDANGFLNIDDEVERIGAQLGEDLTPEQRKNLLVKFLRGHPDNIDNDGTGFALFIEGAEEIVVSEKDFLVPQPDGTGLVKCKICDKNVSEGPGLSAHLRGGPHKKALHAYEQSTGQRVETVH